MSVTKIHPELVCKKDVTEKSSIALLFIYLGHPQVNDLSNKLQQLAVIHVSYTSMLQNTGQTYTLSAI